MANIKVVSERPLFDGMAITFNAPCKCNEIDGLTVSYLGKSHSFTFRDAHGNDLTGLGNLFEEGAYVRAILDTASGYAYLQNTDTNAYIEGAFLKNTVTILSQPVIRTVEPGEEAIFSVVATGKGLTYQWQWYKEAIDAWTASTVSGNQTATISVEATETRNGYKYRCIVTDSNGNIVTSDAVTLTVKTKLRVVDNPVSKSVPLGEIATFHVAAVGYDGLSYQWQYLYTDGQWRKTTMEGNTTDTLIVEGKTSRNGYQYRCVITDGEGNQVTSNPATLTVTAPAVQIFTVWGEILADAYRGLNDTEGVGTATIMIKNGFAEIHFSLLITRAATGDNYFAYGIDPELLRGLNSNIPVITPVSGGTCNYFHGESVEDWHIWHMDADKFDLGGTLDAKTFSGVDTLDGEIVSMWVPSRIYQTEGGGYAVGSWPAEQVIDHRIIGVCYGIVGDTATQAVAAASETEEV